MKSANTSISITAATRLNHFGFALILICVCLAPMGCDTVDSNEPSTYENVFVPEHSTIALAPEISDNQSGVPDGNNDNNVVSSDNTELDAKDVYGNPIKDDR